MTWLKKPSTTGGIGYLVVVAGLAVGMVVVALGAWRTGVTIMGLSFALAFVMRAALPDGRAGMLRVRRRLLDVAVLALCGAVLLLLAVVIPNRK